MLIMLRLCEIPRCVTFLTSFAHFVFQYPTCDGFFCLMPFLFCCNPYHLVSIQTEFAVSCFWHCFDRLLVNYMKLIGIYASFVFVYWHHIYENTDAVHKALFGFRMLSTNIVYFKCVSARQNVNFCYSLCICRTNFRSR